jgi:hypothetical protein
MILSTILSFFHEPPLIFIDDFRKELLEPVFYDLGHNFVRCITQRDGPKYGKRGRIMFFGDKCKKGRIGGTSHPKRLVNILNHPDEIKFDSIPTFPVEMDCKTIWSRGLVWSKIPYSLMNFFFCDFLHECTIFFKGNHEGDVLQHGNCFLWLDSPISKYKSTK